jgi:Sulfotransferase family
MTVNELSRRPAEAAESARAAPVIVMAYTGSGADQLRTALSACPGLTCTIGTGILPLCHHAVTTWQAVDGRGDGASSPLGIASARTLCAGLVTAILAGHGGSRWCEFATAPPAAAQTFARLYPQARFLIVHRRADTVVRAIIGASRWGLTGPEFAPFVSAFPASSVAALASYWVTHTTQQLEFEQAHRALCLRVRIEDLTANAEQSLLDIGDFLALDRDDGSLWLAQDNGGSEPADANLPATGIPLAQIPPSLLAQLGELHQRLGYPPPIATEA